MDAATQVPVPVNEPVLGYGPGSPERERLTRALEDLSPRFREVLVLRELEGCSYKEIAAITSMPIGTVMSALARARQRLQRSLTRTGQADNQEAKREL